MIKQRLENLKLLSVAIPATAKVSIIHRFCSELLLVVFATVFLLWSQPFSIPQANEHKLNIAVNVFDFIACAAIFAFLYSLNSGIRQLFIYFWRTEKRELVKTGTNFTIAFLLVTAMLLGGFI